MHFPISKSVFYRANRCSKFLFLNFHSPELKDPFPEDRKVLMRKSSEIKKLGEQLFPGGIKIYKADQALEESAAITQQKILESFDVLYDAVFVYNKLAVTVDVLKKESGGWVTFEIKNSVRLSPIYIKDLKLVHYVLAHTLSDLIDIRVLTINPDYILKERINYSLFFNTHSVFSQVKSNPKEIEDQLELISQILSSNQEPQVSIGRHCTSPFDCEFLNHCWGDFPDNSVLRISSIPIQDRLELWKKGQQSIHQIEDVNAFASNVKNQIISNLEGKEIVNLEKINLLEKKIKYPVLLFDMEFFSSAVPIIEGTKPFEQIPFAFTSFLVNEKNEILQEKVFVATPSLNTEEEIVIQLKDLLASCSSVMIYDKGMEMSWVRKLKKLRKHSDFIQNWNKPVIDLYEPIRKGYYYHPEMKGKYSIKQVYQAVFGKDLFENNLISSGLLATYYYQTLFTETDSKLFEEIMHSLREYSKSDVEALFQFWRYLKELSIKGAYP